MADRHKESGRETALPEEIRPLFWDHDFAALQWRRDREFIVGRVLAAGTWDNIRWLRGRIGDRGVRDWIERHAGRGLSRQQLRFWDLILGLPHDDVDRWLAGEGRQGWDQRAGT